MGDSINVDFSQLRPPDFVGDYVNAFKVGQDLGRQAAAPAGEPPSAARIAALSPEARARAGQQADLLAGVGLGLKGLPYTERPAVLAHLAPALAARGVPAAALAGFDPSDGNLDAAVASLRSLEAMLTTPGG